MFETQLTKETLDAFHEAQSNTIRLTRSVTDRLTNGMSEQDIERLAVEEATKFGFYDWFHRPVVRFNGVGGHYNRASSKNILKSGTIVEMDMGPATKHAFGDFAVTFAFDSNESNKLVDCAQGVTRATVGFANQTKCIGELFVFADAWATNRCFTLSDNKSIGHRCFAREGNTAYQWPKMARAAILLRRNRIGWFNPRKMSGLFSIQPLAKVDGKIGGFEEMVYVFGDEKRVIGRDSLDEVGTW